MEYFNNEEIIVSNINSICDSTEQTSGTKLDTKAVQTSSMYNLGSDLAEKASNSLSCLTTASCYELFTTQVTSYKGLLNIHNSLVIFSTLNSSNDLS